MQQYAEYVALLARTYPTVKDFIVGNEPNQPRFHQPQFNSAGQNVSAAAYYSVLAAAYDALKAVDPAIRVVGLGLTARQRRAECPEQRLHLAVLPAQPREGVPQERPDAPAHGRTRVPSLPGCDEQTT